jgi:hypothetical protein
MMPSVKPKTTGSPYAGHTRPGSGALRARSEDHHTVDCDQFHHPVRVR